MKSRSLLQAFALDKDGRMRSVDEVARGLACECVCPCCGDMVIARQGDIRGWHFAHTSGADCAGAGEGSLHRAAKQLVVETKGLMLPEASVTRTIRLPQGLSGTGTASAPAAWINFGSVEVEQMVGDIRPDLVAIALPRMLFIEIAVTNPVSPEKAQAIERLGTATLEVDLASSPREDWDWDLLRELVIDATYTKRWIRPMDHLIQEAIDRATEDALATAPDAPPPPATTQSPPAIQPPRSGPPCLIFSIGGRYVYVREYSFGLTLWSPFDPILNPRLKDCAQAFDGRWQRSHKNWIYPRLAKDDLLAFLREWADGPPRCAN